MFEDLRFGQAFERLAEAEVLSQLFSHCTIKEVGRDKYWRRHGVDFVVRDALVGENILVEIKADRKDTGNIVMELYTEMNDGTRKYGWFHTTKSDFIVYFVLSRRQYFLVDVAKMRQLVLEHEFPVKSSYNPWGRPHFYTVPISFMEEHFIHQVVDEATWEGWLDTHIKEDSEPQAAHHQGQDASNRRGDAATA